MKQVFLLLNLMLLANASGIRAQKSITFYRTATSYESFKWDKLPFAMATIIPDALSHDSVDCSILK